MIRRSAAIPFTVCAVFALTLAVHAADTSDPFVGDWALTLPDGHAGWLGVTDDNGKPTASLLWNVGSVLPVEQVRRDGDALIVTRGRGRDAVTFTARADGDTLRCTLDDTTKSTFAGKRIPPPPPAPDLSRVKFGEPITLLNGQDLTGWRLTDPAAVNGWSARDGLLVNEISTPHPPGKSFGNLRTDREFEDFQITLEVKLEKGQNSGVYIRGMYEVQVADTYGRKPDPHNMGAIYSRITPSESAEKPPGEWQTLDITFVDRHVTVVLNGKRIIDNQPIAGCTGGALWSDPLRPGPIYLQGDHTGVEYRNIVLRPVVK
jgi:hypothetical protein